MKIKVQLAGCAELVVKSRCRKSRCWRSRTRWKRNSWRPDPQAFDALPCHRSYRCGLSFSHRLSHDGRPVLILHVEGHAEQFIGHASDIDPSWYLDL